MNDKILIEKVKSHSDDKAAVESLLIELLKSGEVSTEQLKNVLGKPSKDFPKGLTFNKDPRFITESPSFVTKVLVKFARMNGNKKAFCC